MEGKTAVFFCSASFDIDPKFNQAARDFVRAACLRGYTIASGGTTKGTMKVVVDTARECGAWRHTLAFSFSVLRICWL